MGKCTGPVCGTGIRVINPWEIGQGRGYMVYAAIGLSLLFVFLFIAFNVRSNHWRNRRKKQRRELHDRRVGLETPRHKKRRAEEHLG